MKNQILFNLKYMIKDLIVILIILLILSYNAIGQPAPMQSEYKEVNIVSAIHNNPKIMFESFSDSGISWKAKPVEKKHVSVPGADWIRIHFEDYNLGQESFIRIYGSDGAKQELNTVSMQNWDYLSARFNGGIVAIYLYKSPDDDGIYFRVKNVSVGKNNEEKKLDISEINISDKEATCGIKDDRIRLENQDLRIARVMGVGCTAWLIADGSLLTAGHCVGPKMTYVEFNVPLSNEDGATNAPFPIHAYPIDLQSIKFTPPTQDLTDNTDNYGKEWAVFRVHPNSNHGLLPHQAYNNFFRISNTRLGESLRITGFGIDNSPPGKKSPNFRNSFSQTQQTHFGNYLEEIIVDSNQAYLSYRVDTMKGNSGSPIIESEDPTVSIGIHTDAGCQDSDNSGNKGTSFNNEELVKFINSNYINSEIFIDQVHPIVRTRQDGNESDGTLLKPYISISEALNKDYTDKILNIIAGSYNEQNLLIDQPTKINALFGSVIIGR